ncbi:MAG: serine/threonine-protein kinase [Candidatus Woesearchaeota archaeon]|nr:serine/threonine-protein kinase [Candidatus Woesearchaeota archaeon]
MVGLLEDIADKLSRSEIVKVGRYALKQKLGEGAFAAVYLGAFDEFGRLSGAVKIPKSPAAFKNVRSRQKVLSALGKCAYAPNLIDCGEHAGVPFIVEELCESSLADVIEKNRETSHLPDAKEVVALGKQLLTAIDYFHRLGETDPEAAKIIGPELLHADIKPSNILKHGDGWQFTDFGGVSPEKCGANELKLSYVNSVSLGSVKNDSLKHGDIFVSPEVRKALISGKDIPATVSSDLFSIGAVLFTYATNQSPDWQADPREVRSDLPENFTQFFNKLLHGNPAKRYQSAKEALNALERVLEAENAVPKEEPMIIEKGPDRYIIGIEGNGEYSLFIQPALRESIDFPNKKVKVGCDYDCTDHGCGSGSRKATFIPKIFYVKDLDKIVSVSIVGEGYTGGMLAVKVFDKDLSLKDENRLNGLGSNFSVSMAVLRHKDGKGWALRVAHDSNYNHHKVLDLTESGLTELDSGIQGGLFSRWKTLDSFGFEDDLKLCRYDGTVSIGKTVYGGFKPLTELPFKHVNCAYMIK